MVIQLNPLTKVVEITSPTTTVTVQELVNTIRDWEDELANLSYAKVIDAVGKADLGGGVSTSITLTLSSTWQIQFWSGVGIAIIKDGTTVGGVGGNPILATGGADTIIVNNTVGGTVGTISGTVPTVEQIADGVWDEDLTGHTTPDTAGMVMQETKSSVDALLDESGGKWEISANQMVVYKADNVTELMRFNLFDSSGNPAMTNVFKRERVP